MKREKLAEALDGQEYPGVITPYANEIMEGTDLVVVFGGSDDLMEFWGAINDELGCYEGGRAFLTNRGLLENECEEDGCPYFQREIDRAQRIDAIWCPKDKNGQIIASWTYETSIPHSTFRAMEDGDIYCIGIVFNLSDALPPTKSHTEHSEAETCTCNRSDPIPYMPIMGWKCRQCGGHVD